MENIILRYTLQNAIRYNGKANPGAVIGKILKENPKLKKDIKLLIKEINKVVKLVNSMDLEDQKEKLKELDPKLLIKKKKEVKKREIPDLPNVKKKVVMRFAPNPNGPPSLGHCRPGLWNWFLVQKYKGSYVLRFDDTDPRIKIPLKKAYDWYKEDLKWLKVKPNKVVIQSKRLKIYYDHAKKLIQMDGAYVCTCKVEIKRRALSQKRSCVCRELDKKDTLKRWGQMFKGYKEGEAVLRVKTDLQAKDPALRDWAAFRIIDKGKHPLVKAKVWPLLNFASAIDDHLLGITHILRGVDLRISDNRQKYLYDYFKWTYPFTIYNGKLLMKKMKSTSEIGELIKEKKLEGWDDIRAGTVMSLRRRGYQPEAIINFIKEVGVNPSDINVSMEILAAHNREVSDAKTKRYFFISNGKKVKIKDVVKKDVKVPSHPDKNLGFRKFKVGNEFYIQDKLKKGKMYRFMHLFNFRDNNFVSEEYDSKLEAKVIHWLPVSRDLINVELVMGDGKIVKGLGEDNLTKVKIGELIQFERVGFCRLDKKDKDKMTFWFAHR